MLMMRRFGRWFIDFLVLPADILVYLQMLFSIFMKLRCLLISTTKPSIVYESELYQYDLSSESLMQIGASKNVSIDKECSPSHVSFSTKSWIMKEENEDVGKLDEAIEHLTEAISDASFNKEVTYVKLEKIAKAMVVVASINSPSTGSAFQLRRFNEDLELMLHDLMLFINRQLLHYSYVGYYIV